MRYEERRSSSRGRSSRGYAEAKNRYYSTRGNQEAEGDHFDSEDSYRRERSFRYDRREDDNRRSRSPYGRSAHGRSVRDESDDYTPSSRSRSYRPNDIDRELARHDNGYRRNESPYRGRNNRDSPVSESSENQESYSDRVQRSGRMAPRMVDSSRNGRDYGHYNDNAYDDGYSRYSGTKSRSTSQSSDSYTTDDDDDYDANCMNTLFNGQEEGHGRSSGNILSYKKKGKNASELQLKMTLPLPLQLMDNLEKMVPSKSTIESALETFRVKGGKLAKKCELDYSRLEDQVIIDEEFAGGIMPQFQKALFEDQSEDTTDDVGKNIVHLNGRKMIPQGRHDETKSYSTGPRRPESLPGHVMVDEGITCVSSGPTDAFDDFHPESGPYEQGHTDYASRLEAGPDILRKINAGLAGRSQGPKMRLGDEMERPSFDEGMLPSLSPQENQYARATPKQRDALSKFNRRTEPSALGKPWIPASKQPLDIVDQAYPSFDAPADEAIKTRGAVRQELPIEPQSNLQFGVDGIPTAVGYGRNRDDRDMHTVCSDLTGDDELLYVEEIPIIKNLPVEHEQEEPGEIPPVQPTRVAERSTSAPFSESHDYRHFKGQPKTDVISSEQERTSGSNQWDDNDNLSRRMGSSRLRERRDLDVEIFSERSASRSRVGNRLSYQERSQFSNVSRRGYQLQSPDEPSYSSRNRTNSRSRTLARETESQNSETVQTKSEVHRSSSVSRSRRTRSEASSFDDAPMDEERSDNVNSRGALSTRSGSSKETPSRSGRPVARTTLLTTVSIGTPNDSAERNTLSASCSETEPENPGSCDLRQRAAAARMEAMHGAGGANMKSPANYRKPFDEINEGDELMMPQTKAKSFTTPDECQKADPLGCRGAAPSSSFGDTTAEGRRQQNVVDNVDSEAAEIFSEYNKNRASRNLIMDPEGDIPDNDTRLEPEGEIQTVVSDPATWCEETKVSPERDDRSAALQDDQVIGEPDAENLTVKSVDASENEEIINMERSVKSEERSQRSKEASVARFTPTQDMDEESQISTPIQTLGGNRVYSEIDAMSQAVEVNYLGGLSVIASVAPTVSECEPPLAIAPTVETQGTHGQTTFSMDTPVQAPPAGTFDAYDREHWNFSQPQGKLDTDDFYGGHEDDEEGTQYHFDERQAKLSALLPARGCGASKAKTRSLVLPQEFVAKAFTNMIALVVFFFTEWLRYLTFTYKRRPVQGSNPALPNFRGKDANRDVQTTNSEMIQGAPSYRRRRCGSDGLSIAVEPYVPEVQAAVVTPSSARSRSNLRPGVGSATYANIRQSFSRGDARSVASMQGWSAKPSPRVFDFCEE